MNARVVLPPPPWPQIRNGISLQLSVQKPYERDLACVCARAFAAMALQLRG